MAHLTRSRLGVAVLFVAATACAPTPPPHRHGPPGDAPRGERAPPAGPGRLFISPMGEPFRDGERGPVRNWFDAADTDHDGRLVRAEFTADALRFFAVLDTDQNGEIAPAEIGMYETTIAPENTARGQSGEDRGRGGRGPGGPGGGESGPPERGGEGGPPERGGGPGAEQRQGAARFGFLPFPEPVTSADADLNRGVSRAEFTRAAGQRFVLLDTAHRGYLTFDTLPPMPGPRGGRPRPRPR